MRRGLSIIIYYNIKISFFSDLEPPDKREVLKNF